MPDAQDEDGLGGYLVPNFVIPYDAAPNLARLIDFEFLADPRMIDKPFRRVNKLLYDARSGSTGDGA